MKEYSLPDIEQSVRDAVLLEGREGGLREWNGWMRRLTRNRDRMSISDFQTIKSGLERIKQAVLGDEPPP